MQLQVRDIGEFELIERLSRIIEGVEDTDRPKKLTPNFRLRLSIGDDATVWDGPTGSTVLTTDTMVEGVHFNLNHIGWMDLGWKSMVSNLSDIAAMGCGPLYSLVTLGLRGEIPVDGLEEMYRGMLEASCKFGGRVVGGDVVASPVFFISIAMVGAAQASVSDGEQRPLLLIRESARPGDQIVLLGSVGCSSGGLRMIRDKLRFDEETSAHLTEAHYRPLPRVEEGMLLSRHGVSAAMDVSDGLVDDLRKLCKASGVGGVINTAQVPADEFLKRAYPDDWMLLALSGGEDYELLFTAQPSIVNKMAAIMGGEMSVIGEIRSEPLGVTVLDDSGRELQVDRGGWDHFPT